jgi:hypothetical protein
LLGGSAALVGKTDFLYAEYKWLHRASAGAMAAELLLGLAAAGILLEPLVALRGDAGSTHGGVTHPAPPAATAGERVLTHGAGPPGPHSPTRNWRNEQIMRPPSHSLSSQPWDPSVPPRLETR